jgi:predicted ATPase
MLKSWSIQNFKAIVDLGDLKLAPVTILAGRNSSGKSSLLQSILMIAQTLSNQVLDRPLITNGTLVQLGTFEDVLSDLTDSRTMTITFEVNYADVVDLKEDVYMPSHHKVVTTFSSDNNTNKRFSALDASKIVVENTSIEFEFYNWGGTRIYFS